MTVFPLHLIRTRYFPAVCSNGHRPFIVTIDHPVTEVSSPCCPACGAPSRFVPGAYSSTTYLETLEAMIEIFESAELPPPRALSAIFRVDSLLSEPKHKEVRLGLTELTGLERLADLLPPEPSEHELRGFLGLILALLSVYAEARSATPALTDTSTGHPRTPLGVVSTSSRSGVYELDADADADADRHRVSRR